MKSEQTETEKKKDEEKKREEEKKKQEEDSDYEDPNQSKLDRYIEIFWSVNCPEGMKVIDIQEKVRSLVKRIMKYSTFHHQLKTFQHQQECSK